MFTDKESHAESGNDLVASKNCNVSVTVRIIEMFFGTLSFLYSDQVC